MSPNSYLGEKHYTLDQVQKLRAEAAARGECPSSGFFEHDLVPYAENMKDWDGYSYRYKYDNRWWGEVHRSPVKSDFYDGTIAYLIRRNSIHAALAAKDMIRYQPALTHEAVMRSIGK